MSVYTRSFQDTDERMIPENYDGIKFREGDVFKECPPDAPEACECGLNAADVGGSEECAGRTKREREPFAFGSLFKRLPSILSHELPMGKYLPKHFGTEELLIIGAALFLFFGKSSDKECAVMLILLLFVS